MEDLIYCSEHGDKVRDRCECDWGWFTNSTESDFILYQGIINDSFNYVTFSVDIDCSSEKNITFYNTTNNLLKVYCNKSGDKNWDPDTWKAFFGLFTILYSILALISFYKLYSAVKLDKIKHIKRLLDRLFKSPKNLCLLLLTCIGVLRIIWINYDPFRFECKTSRLADRLLYEIVYPFLYGIYSSILLVWGGLYQGINHKKSDPFRILRILIMIMMVLAFPLGISLSVLKGLRQNAEWVGFGGFFVAAGIFLILSGYLLFGLLLFCYIEKKTNSNSLEENNQKSESNRSEEEEDDEVLEAVSNRSTLKRLSLRIGSSRTSRDSNKSWADFVSDDIINEDDLNLEEKEITKIASKKKSIKNSSSTISLITVEDKLILRKLCCLMLISVLLGGFILTLMVFLTKIQIPIKHQIGLQYLVLFVELITCWVVFFVFTRQIEVKEKMSLMFFNNIFIKMRKKEPKIRLPNSLRNIKLRLINFYS